MQSHIHTLDNKLKIQMIPRDSQSVTVMVMVDAGSRYETPEQYGIAHFLEHMFFKGAKKYNTPQKVAEEVDSIGAEFNAYTSKEVVAYYIKCDKSHIKLAIDVLSDMLLHTKLAENEIENEKGVILEELNMYQDTPMYQVDSEFEEHIFGDSPMGHPIIGTKENIKNFTRDDFLQYKNALYTPDNTMVIIAGGYDNKDDIITEITSKFDWQNTKNKEKIPHKKYTPKSHIRIINKKTEQAHLYIGMESYHRNHPLYTASRIVATALGGNMSSRMFQNIREKQGLCYYISSLVEGMADTGIFATRAGVSINKLDIAVSSIIKEIKEIKENGISAKELEKTKNYIIGKTTLILEDSEELASILGVGSLIYNTSNDIEAIRKQINTTTADDIAKAINYMLDPAKLHLVVIGPYAGQENKLEKLLK